MSTTSLVDDKIAALRRMAKEKANWNIIMFPFSGGGVGKSYHSSDLQQITGRFPRVTKLNIKATPYTFSSHQQEQRYIMANKRKKQTPKQFLKQKFEEGYTLGFNHAHEAAQVDIKHLHEKIDNLQKTVMRQTASLTIAEQKLRSASKMLEAIHNTAQAAGSILSA